MTYPMLLEKISKRQSESRLTIKIAICLSLIMACIGLVAVFVHSNYASSYLIIVSTLFSYLSFKLGLKRKNISIIISSLFYLVEVPIQLILSILSPNSIIGSNYNKYYDKWIFYDNNVVLRYFAVATIFLVISIICGLLVEIVQTKKENAKKYSSVSFYYPLAGGVIAFLIQILAYQYGVTNGYVAYFLEGLQLYFLMALVANVFSKKIEFKSIVLLILGIIVYSAYGIVIGRRVFVVRGTLDVLLFLVLLKPNFFKVFIKKHLLVIILLTIGFFALYGFANYWKFGVFDPIGSLIKRIIGLFDGSVVLSYQGENNVNLGFFNYWKCVFNDSGIRANKFYTYSIMLFPSDKANGYAAPIFAASMLYGFSGMIIISFFFAMIMAVVCKSLYSRIKKDRESLKPISLAKSFIMCDTIVLILQKYYLDGNIEILKDFVVPLIAFALVYIKTIISNSSSGDKNNAEM